MQQKNDGMIQGAISINLKEIAKSMGVSTAAVSFVLNGKPGISDSLRESIAQVLVKEGYTIKPFSHNPDPKKAFPAKKIQFIKFREAGYFVENNGDYITKMLDGAEQAAKEHRCALGITNVDKDSIGQTLTQLKYDPNCVGVIFLGTEFFEADSDVLHVLSCPLVVVDTRLGSAPFDTVSIDEQSGVTQAIRHLITLGHRKITYIRSAIKNEESLEREAAFETAVTRMGLDRREIRYLDALPDAQDCHRVLYAALQEGPPSTAYFAANDTMAIGALNALKRAGYRVPEDVSLVGFDNLTIGAAVDPPLTSVDIGKREIGSIAVNRLMEQSDRDKVHFHLKTLVGTRLVVRGSTGPVNESGERVE